MYLVVLSAYADRTFYFWDMQKVLITGANGFVAHYIFQELAGKQFEVIATGKNEPRFSFDDSSIIYESLDFTNQEAVDLIFEKYHPDIVVHCGAISKPDDCEANREAAFRINVTGTLYLLAAAAASKSFLIFLSTDFVFEGKSLNYKEDDERNPVNYYGQTKLLAEDEVMKYPFKWAIVRTILVYGKSFNSRQNLITSTAMALRKGEGLRIFDDQSRTPTWVEDLARAIVAIIDKKAEGVFHISGKDVMTPYQMAITVAEHLGMDRALIERVTENDLKQLAKRPPVTGFDLTRAKELLSYEPTSFETGLKKTLE